jgi:hypothetical protein
MSRRLITDRDVAEGRCGARIVLDGATLITPSARDRAMRLGIAIVEDGVEPGSVRGAARASGAMGASGSGGASGAGGAGGASGASGAAAGCARWGTAACAGNCAACASAGGAIAALPDGLYLVRVDGGRVVSTLPAAGAGLMPRASSFPAPRS